MTQPILPIPFLADLDFRVESAAEGRCRCSLPVAPRIANPYGVLHGGITFTLADTGMGIAAYTLLAPGEQTTTLECSIRYLRPVSAGRIVADCCVIRRGDRFAITEAQVFDDARELAAVGGGTFYISRNS